MTTYHPEWNGDSNGESAELRERRRTAVAQAEAAGEVGAARVAALAKVARAGLYDLAVLCEWERDQLRPLDALDVPIAPRLRLIADMLAIGYSAVVATTTDSMVATAERVGL